jgi:hypothetical protein
MGHGSTQGDDPRLQPLLVFVAQSGIAKDGWYDARRAKRQNRFFHSTPADDRRTPPTLLFRRNPLPKIRQIRDATISTRSP